MKKIFLLLGAVSTLALTSCDWDDDHTHDYVDHDTISEVFEVDNVNFTAAGDFTATIPLDPEIYSSDVVLVYRLSDTDPLGADIWEMIPTTYNLPEGSLSYFTDFSVNSVAIYLDSTFDPLARPDFSLDQIFRIVIVPGYFSENVDTSNYNAVMSALEQQNGPIEIETLN